MKMSESDKPDYFSSPWSWYSEWINNSWVKKTLKNKILICLAWFWFQLGAVADYLINNLDEY